MVHTVQLSIQPGGCNDNILINKIEASVVVKCASMFPTLL